jgi:hypothetical protein
MTMLLDNILKDYIANFWGYGDLKAPIWFVGMEEGGELESNEFNRVLEQWNEEGQPRVVDICPPNSSPSNPWFNTSNPPIQKTWGKLIRATLRATNKSVTNETIRTYQRYQLARPNGDTSLLELMPLPSTKIAEWPYINQSELPFLQSRKAYMDKVCPDRISGLKKLIINWTPRIVVFYSATYLCYWNDIVGKEEDWHDNGLFKTVRMGDVQFYCIQHPTSRGVTNEIYNQLGSHMASAM